MNIRIAEEKDVEFLVRYDKHIKEEELRSIVSLRRVLIVETEEGFAGWLRWNLFWDNTPFMNMLVLLKPYRRKGLGKALVTCWETLMREEQYKLVMTSTMSSEEAQHFYRKLNYKDAGSILLQEEPLEIIFTKEI